jgi:hypothetical protein
MTNLIKQTFAPTNLHPQIEDTSHLDAHLPPFCLGFQDSSMNLWFNSHVGDERNNLSKCRELCNISTTCCKSTNACHFLLNLAIWILSCVDLLFCNRSVILMLTAVCKNLLLGHDTWSSISVLEVESSTSSHTRSLKSSNGQSSQNHYIWPPVCQPV